MIENSNLSASELLSAFIDGELESSESQMLFYQLANDPVLQEEMQELISIRTAFKNSTMQPPPEMQRKIIKDTVLKDSFIGKVAYIPAFFAGFLFNKITASLAGLVLIGTLSFWLVDYFGNSGADINNITKVNNNNDLGDVTANNTQVIKNDNDNNIIADNNEKSKVNDSENQRFTSNITDNISEFDNKSDSEAESSEETYNIPVDIVYSEMKPNTLNSLTKNTERKDYIVFYNLRSNIAKFFDNTKLLINKHNSYSLPDNNIDDIESPLLNDFSIRLMYELNDKHEVGIELGREYIPMQFQGYETVKNRKILYEYNLSYNGLWAALNYQYNFSKFKIFTDFQPYVNIAMGGSAIGPLGKIALGSNIKLTDNISLFGGIKYGAIFYFNQNDLYWTNKYGIDYGLIFNF